MSYHRDRCRHKRSYDNPGRAWRALGRRQRSAPKEVEGVTVYRCPFPTTDGPHWHLGHTPSLEGLQAIAAEIRGLHESEDHQRAG